MPGLDKKTMSAIVQRSGLTIPVFVETGTYLGESAIAAAQTFERVHTIEINDNLYNSQKASLGRFKNVCAYLGDSVKVLPKVLSTINSSAFFWLDAHWSMGNTSYGQEHVPLYRELDCIVAYVKASKCSCIVAIDDVRLFGKMDQSVDWRPINVHSIILMVQCVLRESWFAPSHMDEKDILLLVLENKADGGISTVS